MTEWLEEGAQVDVKVMLRRKRREDGRADHSVRQESRRRHEESRGGRSESEEAEGMSLR